MEASSSSSTESSVIVATKAQLDHEVLKVALREFYSINNASRISSIDTIVDSYLGKEVELLEELKKRYKVEFEPFDKILAEFRLNNPHLPVVEYSSINDSGSDTISSSNILSQSKKEEVSQSSSTITAARGSLAALGIPTIFTDKLMNGVNWKGFTMDSSVLNVADSKKEQEDTVNDSNSIDFASLAKETGHPEELLIQLQRALELNTVMEKQLKQTLKKFDSILNTGKNANSLDKKLPIGVGSPDKSEPIDVEDHSGFAGRSEGSLVAEICTLRTVVDNMRDFIIDTLKRPLLSKEKRNLSTDIEEKTSITNVSENSDESNAPVEKGTKTKEVISSVNTSENSDVQANSCKFAVDDVLLEKVLNLRAKISPNWRDEDELRQLINTLSAEKVMLKQSLLIKDSLISNRDASICSLQQEIRELREQVHQSNRLKGELTQLSEDRIRSTEAEFKENVNIMYERFRLEQEEVLSHLASVAEEQQNWQAALSHEAQAEIIRLRVELAKARRQDAQREREVAYLQRQLTEAAKQLAQYVMESEEADGGNE